MSIKGRFGRGISTRREEKQDHFQESEMENFIDSDSNKKRDKDGRCVRLHVSNISTTMTENAIRELFSKFGKATVFLNSAPFHKYKNKCWGFVDYPTSYEADRAIYALNKAHPYNLNVKWAKTVDESSETEDFKKEILPSSEREKLKVKGRGAHIPIMGRSPTTYKSKRPSFEDFSNDPDGENNNQYSSTKFQHDATPQSLLDTNEVYGQLSRISQGKRSVTMGRGINRSDNIEQYAIPEISSKVEQKIEDYKNNVILKPSKEWTHRYPPDENLPFQTENCPNCCRPSTYLCTNCRKWYCSTECVIEHMQKFGIECQGNENVTTKNGPQTNSYHIDNERDYYIVDKNYIEKQSKEEQHRNEQKDYQGTSRSSIGTRNGKDGISPKQRGGTNKRLSGNGSSFKNGDETDDSTKMVPTKPRRNGNTGNGRKSNNSNHNRSGSPQNRAARSSGGGGGSRRPYNNRNSQHENDVYVRNEEASKSSSNKTLMAKSAELPNVLSKDIPEEVIVSSQTKTPNVYWVNKKSSLQTLMNILKALSTLNKSAKHVLPKIDFVCAASYRNEWFRARIINITNDVAVVRYIDYGNESEVPLQDLKLLPKELVDQEALAFKIKIQGPPVNLNEDDTIVITLINKESDGSLRVAIVGDDSDTIGSSNACNNEDVDEPDEAQLSFDSFDTVHILDGKGDEYLVQLETNVLKLISMDPLLDQHSSIQVEPKLGEMYAKKYGATWCRVKVIHERPLKVLYVDYGNIEIANKNDLHPVPAEFKNEPSMVIKIKLADGTSEHYFNLKFTDSIKVKAIDRRADGTFIVQVKGEEYGEEIDSSPYPKDIYSDRERRAKHALGLVQNGDEGVWTCVQKVMSNECLTGLIILNTNSTDYCKPFEFSECLKKIKSTTNYKPEVADLVIARVGNTWCRGYVMLITDEQISVALIDFGKVVSVKKNNLSLLPKRFQTYPVRQAIRIVLENPLTDKDLPGIIGNVIHLKNVEKTGSSINCKLPDNYGNAKIISWTPFIEEAGLKVYPLKNNSSVVMSAFHTPKSVYLRSTNTEIVTRLAELLEDVATYSTKALPLNRNPLCGELLCVKYKDDGNYYRAQIIKKADDGSYKVNFVDFGNIETVPVTDMQPLPDTFKKVPCFAVKVGLKDVTAHTFDPQAMQYLNRLTLEETVLDLSYEDDNLSEVILSQKDGKIVNTAILNIMEASLKTLENPSEEQTIRLHPFVASDVIYERWPQYSTINLLLVVAVVNYKTVIALNQNSNLIDHLFNYLTPRMTEYCNKASQKAYNARKNEVVLAKYKNEENGEVNWYRALCIESLHLSSVVFFIDYGNYGELPHSDIRSMPTQFMDTPAALKKCTIYGLDDKITTDIKAKIEAKLNQFAGKATVIEDWDNGNATIWIPSFNNELQELGLPKLDPPIGV